MSRARTRCARIEERTLRIGFGIKRASQREIGLPELLAFQPALNRSKPIPFGPLIAHQFFWPSHGRIMTNSNPRVNLRPLLQHLLPNALLVIHQQDESLAPPAVVRALAAGRQAGRFSGHRGKDSEGRALISLWTLIAPF